MKPWAWGLSGAVAGMTLTAAFFALKNESHEENPSCYATSSTPTAHALFTFEGKKYSAADLPLDLQRSLAQQDKQGYDKKTEVSDQAVLRLVLAKEKGISKSLQELPSLEALLGENWVSQNEVRKFYEDNQKSLPASLTFEQLAPSLQKHLENVKMSALIKEKLSALNKDGKFKKLSTFPCGPNVEPPKESQLDFFAPAGKHTLVFVTDYACNQCRALHFSLTNALERWKGKISVRQIVYFGGQNSFGEALAQGGWCASQQGPEKFASYHKAAYLAPLKSPNPKKEDIHVLVEKVAQESTLDTAAFQKCMTSPAAKSYTEATSKFASENGFKDTMGIYLNGKQVMFGSPDQLAELVDETISQ